MTARPLWPSSTPRQPLRATLARAGITHRLLLRALALGLVLSILITWMFSLRQMYERGHVYSVYDLPGLDPDSYLDCRIRAPSDWTIRTWQWSAGLGIRRDLLSEQIWMGSTLGSTQGTAPDRTLIVVASGFPFLGAEYTEFDTNLTATTPAYSVASMYRYGVPLGRLGSLPLRPAPFSFLANWLVWSVVALGILLGTLFARSELRRRKGLCVACGYPIARFPTCPECGEQVRREPSGPA